MDSNPEKRDKARFLHESKITLENSAIGVQREASMYNYCDFGLYIESDIRLEKDAEIRIGIHDSPFAATPDEFECYRGVIQWRKTLKDASYYYGYGVQLFKEDADEKGREGFQGERKQPRKAYNIPLKFKLENRTFEGTTENVSSTGVAVKSNDPVMAGQHITIEIPLKKTGKIARLNGTVSWTNHKGFGVKFLRSE